MADIVETSDNLHADEVSKLHWLRRRRRQQRRKPADPSAHVKFTIGQQIADKVASTMGSWRFIIIQSIILLAWIVLNVTAYVQRWDPYPFILLNLGLSFQAAYAAPFIMMSQNRQQEIDRAEATHDHDINIKAELEIELLHQKIDELREKEVYALTLAVQSLTAALSRAQGENDKLQPTGSRPVT
ncbi:putative membrane protein [Rhodoligotrophos appendicifer]|uniref:DUF1003 domain-containing protein n=1 Tax=Rhodoligotrophos appendicifer TaxID=987056 RepID=UPI00196150E6|nr:DUF1003 domain-containing protein [Rhodoligotrophos appendicifer]